MTDDEVWDSVMRVLNGPEGPPSPFPPKRPTLADFQLAVDRAIVAEHRRPPTPLLLRPWELEAVKTWGTEVVD